MFGVVECGVNCVFDLLIGAVGVTEFRKDCKETSPLYQMKKKCLRSNEAKGQGVNREWTETYKAQDRQIT